MGGYSRRSARRKHVICNGHFRSTPGGWLYTHAPGDGRRVSSVRTVRVSFAGKNSIDHPPPSVVVLLLHIHVVRMLLLRIVP